MKTFLLVTTCTLVVAFALPIRAQDEALKKFNEMAEAAEIERSHMRQYDSDRVLTPVVDGLISEDPAIRQRAVEILKGPYLTCGWLAVDHFERLRWDKLDASGEGIQVLAIDPINDLIATLAGAKLADKWTAETIIYADVDALEVDLAEVFKEARSEVLNHVTFTPPLEEGEDNASSRENAVRSLFLLMTRLEDKDVGWSFAQKIDVTYIIRKWNEQTGEVELSTDTKPMWPTTIGHIMQKLYDKEAIRQQYNGLQTDEDQALLVQALVGHMDQFLSRPLDPPDVQGAPPYKKLLIAGEEALSVDDDKTLQHLVEVLMFLDEPRTIEGEQ